MQGPWWRFAVVMPLLSAFTSCGGQSTTADRKAAAVLSTQSFNLPAGDGAPLSVDAPSPGALAATANWTEVGAEIDVYLTDSTCPGLDELVLGSCKVLARGDNRTAVPQTATLFGAQPGRYQAFVLAVGQKAGSGTVSFTLSP